jgi:hypothetical protein
VDRLLESLSRSPELFPHELDLRNDTVTFIRLSQAEYTHAGFLDARIRTPQTDAHTMPWGPVAASIDAGKLEERCGFIFHIGHVGSTLISRLIGAHTGAFAVREPMLLRTFAAFKSEPGYFARSWSEGDVNTRLGGCLKLLSRTFDAQQHPVIKVSSFVSELAADLLSRASAPKAILMYLSPESYLAAILSGPNSRREAQLLTPDRLRRLHRLVGCNAWRLESLSEGEMLALGWVCEMAALMRAQCVAGERVMRLNFEQFLAHPPSLLFAALRHLDIDATTSEVNAILQGPHMHRYSKAPEYAYDSTLRREVLSQAGATHGAEIRRGLAWIDRAALEFAPVHAAVMFAETAT